MSVVTEATTSSPTAQALHTLRLANAAIAEVHKEFEDAKDSLDTEEIKQWYGTSVDALDSISVMSALVSSIQKVTEARIIDEFPHGTNIEINGELYHRYDETRANGVSYKSLYEKAFGFLSGAPKGVLVKMERSQKSGSKLYERLKSGPFVGK